VQQEGRTAEEKYLRVLQRKLQAMKAKEEK